MDSPGSGRRKNKIAMPFITCFIWVVYTMFKPAGDGQANGQDDKICGWRPTKKSRKIRGFPRLVQWLRWSKVFVHLRPDAGIAFTNLRWGVTVAVRNFFESTIFRWTSHELHGGFKYSKHVRLFAGGEWPPKDGFKYFLNFHPETWGR